MKATAMVELERVSLTFRVRRQHHLTFKEYLLRRLFMQRRNPKAEVRALQEVSFRVQDGERVGIIGANGSGKSTLLRLLAGVYAPSAGLRRVHGRVASLFELALGFEMESTGWKNIYQRGYLQGETAAGIRAKAQAIADFSELGDFLNLPVRYYSAGMLVRLAFAIATAVEPEILLVDEVLGAGDLAFQIKARRRLHDMMGQARILLVVSHDLPALSRMCERAVWLDRGRLVADGPVAEVLAAYTEQVRDADAERTLQGAHLGR
jgi:ABC-type polysaccharide/polyol phosphate transport system ATPase subunit